MAKLKVKIETLKAFESSSFDNQKQKIKNLDKYNFSDYELNNGFDFNFKANNKKQKIIYKKTIGKDQYLIIIWSVILLNFIICKIVYLIIY